LSYALGIMVLGLICDSSTNISLNMYLGSTFNIRPLLINTLHISTSLHRTVMIYNCLLCRVPSRSNLFLVKYI
jgi:hypothetical protein